MVCICCLTETLLSHFPELAPALTATEAQISVASLLEVFAEFTRQAVTEGRLHTFKLCLHVADSLCREDEQLQLSVRQYYLARLQFTRTAYTTQMAQLLMPAQLYAVFTRS